MINNILISNETGLPIAHRFNRIEFGGRGAYFEFETEDIFQDNIHIVEEWRRKSPKWKNKVFFWEFRTNDSSNVKLYYQRKPVTYATYHKSKWYVSVQDCCILLKRGEP